MLDAYNLTRSLDTKAGDPRSILDNITFSAPAAQVTLIVGAPGSGKRSLLEALSCVHPANQGLITLHERDLSRKPLHPNELGVVTTKDRASLPSALSTRETLSSALMLRVGGLTPNEITSRSARLLALCGLETVASELVSNLSLVQFRRLLLAVQLVSDPLLLLCEDFTHDIDAKSERELVALLKLVATDIPGRIVINLTVALSQLPAYDTVIVLHQGHVCFHGPARAIPHYFTIKSIEDLYPRLAMRPAARWGESWTRHRDSYYDAFKIGATPEDLAAALDDDASDHTEPERIRLPSKSAAETTSKADQPANPATDKPVAPLPSPTLLTQTALLVKRRWTLFRRSKGEWRLQVLLFSLLPVLAVLLIWPNKGYLTSALTAKSSPLPPDVLWPAAFTCLMATFVQILIVIYFAVRSSSREIARERELIDRERLGGVGSGALLLSKITFLFPIVTAQALWLGLFVEILTGGLPGPLWLRLTLPVLTGLGFTSLCLAISAHAKSTERAHSRCLTLAFAQVLLAGALLGMPRVLGSVLQPFVTAYFGWSGILAGMAPHPIHEAVGTLLRTSFASPSFALAALAFHILIGLVITRLGLRKTRLS